MTAATRILAGVLAALALTGCGGGGGDLVVYSGRNEALMKPILDRFASESGLDVSVRFADTTELAATILEEGDRARADVFVGQDAGALARLAERGRLAAYAEGMAGVPEQFRASDGTWTGVSARVRVLIVNTEELRRSEWPESIFDLTDPGWKGKLAAPNATNASWIGFLSEMRIKFGDQRTREWLEGLEANDLAVLGSHTDVRRAVAAGEFALGLVNHYYVELQKAEGSPVEAIHTDQGPGGWGAVVNAASAGIVKGGANPENARKLIDFLLTPEVQKQFAGLNHEYPVIPGAEAPGLKPLDSIKSTGIPLEDLGPKLDGTVAMLDEVGLGS